MPEDTKKPSGTGGSNTRSTPVNLIDWVEQQALPLPAPAKVTATLPEIAPVAAVAASAVKASHEPPTPLGQAHDVAKTEKRVYDIATLNALREDAARKNVELKVHPTALKENIWKRASPNVHPKGPEKPRPRALSSESDHTQRSCGSGEEVVLGRSLGEIVRPPYRQPISPPRELPDQKKDGFKRFLKEVASPPHHRVTAGGRIVPRGTQPPPMMIQFGSLEDSVQHRHARQKSLGKAIGKPEGLASNALTLYRKASPFGEADGRAPSNGQPHFFRSQAGSISDQNGGKISNTDMFKTPMPLGYPPPAGVMPLGPPPPSGGVAPYGSGHYLGHWNGPPMYNQLLPIPPYIYPDHPLSKYGPSYPNAQSILPMVARGPPTGQLSVDNSDHGRPNSLITASEEALIRSRDEYAAKLSDLDKHIALNLHRFSSDHAARNAATREELVKTVDFFRVAIEDLSKDTKSSSAHVMHPYQHSGISPYISQQYNFPPAPSQQSVLLHGTDHPDQSAPVPAQAGSFRNSSSSQATPLSAIAPPFVPGNFKTGSTHFSPENTSLETRQHTMTIESPSDSNGGISLTAPRRKITPVLNNNSSGIANVISHDGRIDKSVESAFDGRMRSPFAVPEVEIRDIAYVDRLGLNPARREKLFCSTVEEFQEVIRRAREQATTYSCTPGASKDPAHDAEEDIRCAMQNEEAIALPKLIPDHIANPRPWNWADSAYNARAHQEFAPFLPAEKLQSPSRSIGNSSRWSNSLQPILEENIPDECPHDHAIDESCGSAAQGTKQEVRGHTPHVSTAVLSSRKYRQSALAEAQKSMAPIAQSKTRYEEHNGDDIWGTGPGWKPIGAPEVKMPQSVQPWPRALQQGHRKTENTFLQGMLRFPKFSWRTGNPVPSDAEVMAQQLKFEEISASQWARKENMKTRLPSDRGVNAKEVFEAARAAFFPKARVSVGPSYQNASGSLPPLNERGSPFNRAGDHSATSNAQARRALAELSSPNGSTREKGPGHGVFNSSPLRNVSDQPESAPPSPNKTVEKKKKSPDNARKTPDNGSSNPQA